MSNDDRPEWLEAPLASLSPELAPTRDLWPGIAKRIRRRELNRWVPAAVVASVLLSSIAAYLAWASYRVSWRSDAGLAEAALIELRGPYRRARADYDADWLRRRAAVDPEVAAVIDRNLAIIATARGQLEEALAQTPDDPALRDLLGSTLATEIDLYRRAQQLAPPPI